MCNGLISKYSTDTKENHCSSEWYLFKLVCYRTIWFWLLTCKASNGAIAAAAFFSPSFPRRRALDTWSANVARCEDNRPSSARRCSAARSDTNAVARAALARAFSDSISSSTFSSNFSWISLSVEDSIKVKLCDYKKIILIGMMTENMQAKFIVKLL